MMPQKSGFQVGGGLGGRTKKSSWGAFFFGQKNIEWGWGHEATETGFAYAPVSQAHGHNHIVQCRGGGGGGGGGSKGLVHNLLMQFFTLGCSTVFHNSCCTPPWLMLVQFFTLGSLKMEDSGTDLFDIVATQNDHPTYVKHF